jgi:hypothetical protein
LFFLFKIITDNINKKSRRVMAPQNITNGSSPENMFASGSPGLKS